MTNYYLITILLIIISYTNHLIGQPITTGTLLDEMIDMKRLAELPNIPYKYIQFSSYDRRSTNVSEQGWFENSDGFGNEPIPGFEDVLRAPDEDGIGDYLICDVKGSGAILRLWTARMNGEICLFLDGNSIPVYKGNAQEFFWETAAKLTDGVISQETGNILRQFDATYFPIPFAKSCRIEWTGDLKKLHFYHVGIRFYNSQCEVETFNTQDVKKYLPQLEKLSEEMSIPGKDKLNNNISAYPIELVVPGNSYKELFFDKGSDAIEFLSLKIEGGDLNKIMRQNVLSIYYDGSPSPQVQSPIGDFFGAAPGVNPYQSLPFSVYPDGIMECRFFMPYKDSVRIEIENATYDDVKIRGTIKTSPYKWEEGKSMYFGARWRINHGLTASDKNISDIPYLMAFGQGRIVGATSFLFNPSNAPKSHGNWWGEGDEKIFIDQDTFPSLFGTGSEDYYNYSWSSSDIFCFPYSGQPRNDGPGNRGFVSNYRWHILDDIPFNNRLAFYMELQHHGIVPGFSYGRMVYIYSLPGVLDDHSQISRNDISEIFLPEWSPIAYRGSNGFRFINAEELINLQSNIQLEKGTLWANGEILMWTPAYKGEKIKFSIPNIQKSLINELVLTLAHLPDGGEISVFNNERIIKFDNKDVIKLYEPYRQALRNHTSERISLNKDENEITIEYVSEAKNRKVGIDFIWIIK